MHDQLNSYQYWVLELLQNVFDMYPLEFLYNIKQCYVQIYLKLINSFIIPIKTFSGKMRKWALLTFCKSRKKKKCFGFLLLFAEMVKDDNVKLKKTSHYRRYACTPLLLPPNFHCAYKTASLCCNKY